MPTTGGHGADIASQRIDDLDRTALADVLESGPRLVVDIGCGLGLQGFRFALLGAGVRLFDLLDIEARVEQFRALFPQADVRFHRGDALQTLGLLGDGSVEVAYSQRTIHYLPFERAVELAATLFRKMAGQGRLYLSASGIGSELGDGYQGRDAPLGERFCVLAPEMARKHQIAEPVCLYGEEDVAELARRAGFEPRRIWSSSFGNIKAILERP